MNYIKKIYLILKRSSLQKELELQKKYGPRIIAGKIGNTEILSINKKMISILQNDIDKINMKLEDKK